MHEFSTNKHEQDNWLEEAYHSAPCGFHSLDADGFFLEINDTELQWLGYKREEMVGVLNFADIILPQFQQIYEVNYPIFKENGRTNELYFVMRAKNDETFPVLLSSVAVFDANGEFSRSNTVVFRVTETSQRQHNKDALIAIMTHDLKNHAIGGSNLLKGLIEKQSEHRNNELSAYLNALLASQLEMIDILQNMTQLYRLDMGSQALALEMLELKDLLQDCLNIVSPALEDNNQFVTTNLALDNSFVEGDRVGIRHVLLNLIRNAIKFTPEGGEIKIALSQSGKHLVVSVEDSGEGISPEEQKFLFSNIWQGAKGVSIPGSTGLGLYLCNKIALAHKGEITCQSLGRSGATFNLVLPKSQNSR